MKKIFETTLALTMGVIIIPAAFLFSRPMGARGVWSAFCFTELVTAGLAFAIL